MPDPQHHAPTAFEVRDVEIVRKGLEQCGANATELDMSIHPRDQMYVHSQNAHRNAGAALTQYFNVALQQYRCVAQIISRCGLDANGVRLLDFACGFGRLIRFLIADCPRDRIFGAEIQTEAVEYVRHQFGVGVFQTNERPTDFKCDERFQFIWAASLFTHLPEHLFTGWLKQLTSILTSDGVLCFSVRDPAILPAGKTIPQSGFLYEAESETADLSTEIYGTTYVTASYMQGFLADLPGFSLVQLPRLLANEQDVYVFSRREFDEGCFSDIDRGSWGWLDVKSISRGGNVHLEGWAGSLKNGPASRIDINVAGETHTIQPHIARPDVVDVFGEPHLLMSGWRLECAVAESTEDVPVIVTASGGGSSALVYAGYATRD